ncbi:MAG: hypothetical protein HY660_06880 [Armatimonadetes bacterium]|nr:hypothetical protein [Armatimonadota bacterium]
MLDDPRAGGHQAGQITPDLVGVHDVVGDDSALIDKHAQQAGTLKAEEIRGGVGDEVAEYLAVADNDTAIGIAEGTRMCVGDSFLAARAVHRHPGTVVGGITPCPQREESVLLLSE